MRRGRSDSRGNALGTPSMSSRSRSRSRSRSAAGGMLPPQYGTSQQSRISSSSGSRVQLVGLSTYRLQNLEYNSIYRVDGTDVPDHLRQLSQRMGTKRPSPEPSPEDIEQSQFFKSMDAGCTELDLLRYTDTATQNRSDYSNLQVSDDTLVYADWLPNHDPSRPEYRVSQPKPDSLYGYNLNAFERHHRMSLGDMHRSLSSNNQNLILPFLVIEYKASGPANNGSLWEAENQCLGGSTACLNIASNLNKALEEASRYPGPVQRLDNAVFSIAMTNSVAKLYVSWQSDMGYFSSRVGAFCLVDPDGFIQFRRRVRNIVDWGMNQRLEHTMGCLDVLIEEKRLIASHNAKSRSPPR